MTTAAVPADPALSRRLHQLVWPLSAAQLVSWGAIYYSFSLLLEPMEAELGWTRADMTGALSLGLVATALSAVPAGRWIDRHGGRGLMTLGSLAAGALLFAWSQVEALWAFYLIWIGLGATMAAVLYEPAFAVLVGVLGPLARRGITAMTLVGGFASTVFVPLTHVLIESFGWRDALVVLAALNIVFCALVHLFVLRGQAPEAPPAPEPEADGTLLRRRSPLGEALRLPAFWCLAVAFTASATLISVLTFHIVPLLTERGFALAQIVTAITLIGPMQVAGRIVLAVTETWVSVRVAGLVALGLPIVAVGVLLAAGPAFWWLALFAVLYGAANGMNTIVRATAVPEFIGRVGYGQINGGILLAANGAKAGAPFAASLLWAGFGGYDAVLWALLGLAAVALAAFGLAGRFARA